MLVGALRVMLDRGLWVCQDRRLDAYAPTVIFSEIDEITRKYESRSSPWTGMPKSLR